MKPQDANRCSCSAGSCSPTPEPTGWKRRDFLKSIGVGAGALALQPWGAMAGPFTRTDFEKLVPADKKLSPDWVRSLTARGEREVYRGADLEKIGMPIGGICAGQVYLGGDGRLWHWDIFNQHIGTGPGHYAHPMKTSSPVDQGFALRVTSGGQTRERPLDAQHWPDVSFIGEYPIGYVKYRDPDLPIEVNLEAFSPFIPLNTYDSSLPATIMEFRLKNSGNETLEIELTGWLENAVCLYSAETRSGIRRNRLVRRQGLLCLDSSAEEAPVNQASARPDITFEAFEGESYGQWSTTGTAFGTGPVEITNIPDYQGDVAGQGKRVVNSHASAPGDSVVRKDNAQGTLTSPPFKIERNYITFLIGGGAHKGRTCMNLLVDGKPVATATGRNNNRMGPMSWDVHRWTGQTAQLEIVDHESGGWGNIGIDDIVFSDRPREPLGPLADEPDFGTMALALLDPQAEDYGIANTGSGSATAPTSNAAADTRVPAPDIAPFDQKLVGSLTRKLKLEPGASDKATFVITWHMPNLKMDRLPPGRHYATRFDSAVAVAAYLQENLGRLSDQTRLWHDTWYDSTLPYWFLDRTFLNASILASSTCYRFGNGRFYGWEGVGCCAGTCGHVWQYAHAVARLFPELERITRENVDFGLSLQPDGAIHFRGEFNNIPAIDAQAGAILRALREHQCSPDDTFLKRTWPKIKKAMDWLIAKDANGDGLIESNQHNTLDTDWFGPVAWLSGLYLAALSAAATMAEELGDQAYTAKCRTILQVGQRNIVAQLFDEEYFINKPDPRHLDAINSGTGCEIDQVFGQSWAFQVGLPRVLPQKETVSALKSLWRYNFTPDVGPYRDAYKAGRWYAMPGEAGLLMCTFPRSDWDYAQAKGKGPDWAAGYFNECMNGFEYQAAGHMIWEGLLTEGLAVTRAIHDRYHPSRRNPWNEIECGDHYARSMASYGVFLAACGFEYHGPKGHLGFSPSLTPEDFRTPFTAAEAWGTYQQKHDAGSFECALSVKSGNLRLRSLALPLPSNLLTGTVAVAVNGRSLETQSAASADRLTVIFPEEATLAANQRLEVRIS